MSYLKVPSLQHLARNWRSDPHQIKRLLVSLVENGPTFNYNPLFVAVRDMLVFGQPYSEIIEGIRRGVKRADVRDNLLNVMPLIRDYFDGINPVFVQAVERRYYPVGRGLMVPFDPPLIYGEGGRLHFPWFSFWRSNPLAGERLSLFVSVVEDVLLQDPDLEEADFVILDFSAPKANEPRDLRVIDAQNVPHVSEQAKVEMLSTFAEGYFLAQAELSGTAETQGAEKPAPPSGPSDQLDLFDGDR
jgi:hypothetical protein